MVKNSFKLVILLGLLLTTNSSFSLVDYSDQNGSFDKAKNNKSKIRPTRKLGNRSTERMTRTKRGASSGGGPSFSLGSKYEKLTLKNFGNATVDRYVVDGSFKTNFNLFLDFNYWGVLSYSKLEKEDNRILSDSGNLTIKLGFNWLKLGGFSDQVNIDLYGGASIGKADGRFASSRDDKIVGIETSKRFMSVVIGFGYEMILTGTPANEEDLQIGNISKLSAGIAVVVSPDISLLVEGATIKVSQGQVDGENPLTEQLSFAYVSPKLILKIGQSIEWTLGASFITRRPNSSAEFSPMRTKLWNLDNCYGNSIFSGIGISL